MKKTIDTDGRILYKFGHSTAKGGNVYIRKTYPGKIIAHKQGLRNCLNAISKKFSLIDSTIKIYEDIFFFFFHIPKSLAPAILLDSIDNNIPIFAEWDEKSIFIGVDDL